MEDASSQSAATPPGDPRFAAGGHSLVALRVNGKSVAIAAGEQTPLLYVLRNDLGLAGTRFGCGDGLCGACTVLVDGRPISSCDTPLLSVAGRDVTTIEGLAGEDGLHPLQQAFLDEEAGQCGYCLSGIIVAAKALLDANARPTRAEIVAALDSHLCRCGTHNRIIRAIEVVAAQE